MYRHTMMSVISRRWLEVDHAVCLQLACKSILVFVWQSCHQYERYYGLLELFWAFRQWWL